MHVCVCVCQVYSFKTISRKHRLLLISRRIRAGAMMSQQGTDGMAGLMEGGGRALGDQMLEARGMPMHTRAHTQQHGSICKP